jgi:hypothetical protein
MKWKFFIAFILIFFTACEKTGDYIDTMLKFYGDTLENIGTSIAIADDGYIICGQLTEITRRDGNYIESSIKRPGIIKTGFDGNMVWQKYLSDGLPGSVAKVIVLDDGSIVCAGQVTDTITSQSDIFVVHLNSDGTGVVPPKIYKAAGNQLSNDILRTEEGFLVLGTTDVKRTPLTETTGNKAGKEDLITIKVNNNLEQIDSLKPWGFPDNDAGAVIKADPSGGYIVAGTTERYLSLGNKNDIFIARINTDGNVTEYSIIGTSSYEYARDMEVLDDGYLIAGTKGSETEKQSAYIVKVPRDIMADPVIQDNPVKDISWSVNAMSKYKSNYYVVAGQAGAASSAKMLVFLIDSEGKMVEGKEMITGSTGIQAANDVVSDNDDYVIAVGINSYENSSMITLLKFRF